MDDTGRAADRAADGALVERIRSGDEAAFGELYERWVDRVHDLASRIVGRDAAADVTQEAFLVAWRSLGTLRDPASFGGWLLRTTRNRALDVLERSKRTRATDTEGFDVIERAGPSSADVPAGFGLEDSLVGAHDPVRALERAEARELVWESVGALGERDATVLDLTLRHGLTPAEVGDVVGVNRNAANQMLHRARNRLGDSVRARVLWRGGTPRCTDLATDLERHGVTAFGPDAVQVTTTHADGCGTCTEHRRLGLAPTALFGAIPIPAVPEVVREQVAAALVSEGVPVDGSGDGSSGGDGGPEVGDTSSALPQRSTPSTRRGARTVGLVAGVVAVATVAAIGWFVLAGDGDDDEGVVAPASVPTSTSSTTTTTLPPESPGVVPPTTSPVTPTAPANAPPADDAPVVQSPPPGAPVVSFGITPGSGDSTWTPATAPRLVWSVTGGARIEVTGPGLSSTSRTGDVALCPTEPPGWSVCPFVAGEWTYSVEVFDTSGMLLAGETAILVRP